MLAKYLLVVAATVTGVCSATSCAAQAQFDQCKQTMQQYIDACGVQDYSCLCTANKNLLTQCYPLCPSDPGKASQQSVVTSWCVSAGGDKTTTSTPVAIITPTSAAGTKTPTYPSAPASTETSTSGQETSPTNKNSSSPSGTTSASSPKQSGSSADMLAPAGFLVAAAAAVMGFAL